MRSLIVAVFARALFVLMLVVSIYVLYRGHNEPGGGFVGGLIAASGFALVTLAEGTRATRITLRVDPPVLMGIGILCAFTSGLPGLVRDGSFLAHQWVVAGDMHLGTPLLFDLGVYLVVLGGVLALLVRFYESPR